MGYCYFCEKEPAEKYFGYYCADCREIKNIMNVYGREKVLGIVKSCCIRNDKQIQNKIDIELGDIKLNKKDVDKVYNLRNISK